MQQLSIRRGDTFYAECQLVDEFGAGAPITGMVVSARLVDRGGNVAKTLATQVLNDNEGKFALSKFETTTIPAALYTLEINYSINGTTVTSTAFELMVSKAVIKEPVRFAQVGSVIGNTRVVITVPATDIEIDLWSSSWDVEWA